MDGSHANDSYAWRTDEVFVKVRGNTKYLFALMDDETRFWIAQQVADHKGTSDVRPMFREAQRIAGKNPTAIISDGASNFAEASSVFYVNGLKRNEQTKHIRDITFDGERHNNKMEAMNGQTIRQREKVIRGIKKVDSPIFQGTQLCHNLRPHISLEGKTPSEVAGIKIEGANKWITLIQNAKKINLIKEDKEQA